MKTFSTVGKFLKQIVVRRRDFPGSLIRITWDGNTSPDFDKVYKARHYLARNCGNIRTMLLIQLVSVDGFLLAKSVSNFSRRRRVS